MRLSRLTPALLALAITGCGGGGAAPPASTATPAASPLPPAASTTPATQQPAWNWPNYHRDAAHTGYAPGSPPAGRLAIAWRRRLNGAVYGQPLAVGGLVIAATEGDSVFGLDRATGQERWRVHVGTPVPLSALPCGNIDPLGITGTPVYDPATGLVYAVAETAGYRHVLVGVNAQSGQVAFRRDIPTPDGQPRFDQQRGALAVAGGRIYIPFGGLDGDCGPYRGSVVGVPVSGHGPLISYLVPTARAGGIWTSGGLVTSPGGTLYAGVGNGAATSGPDRDGDAKWGSGAPSVICCRTWPLAGLSWYRMPAFTSATQTAPPPSTGEPAAAAGPRQRTRSRRPAVSTAARPLSQGT